MPLHLVKLCVGAESIADQEAWIAKRAKMAKKRGEAAEHIHTTRMTPKREVELRDGGSLYWVIKGMVSCRQAITDLRGVTDKDGIGRCQIVLDRTVIPVEPRPRGAFQGWRYLTEADAPRDLAKAGGGKALIEMPENLRRELAELGLI